MKTALRPNLVCIQVVDSHTAGEPTRLVVEGGPDLGEGPLSERVERFRLYFDTYRSAIVNEPRGSDTLIGALLCKPHRADCQLGVIFFNNVGYLGMCGHGTIGLIASLAYSGACTPGAYRIDTPVGPVNACLKEDGRIEVENVASFRKARDVRVVLPELGSVRGDVAWGGNWFFLTDQHGLEIEPENIEVLTEYAWRLRQALNAQGYANVDHVELFAHNIRGNATRGRNFVLCPGKAYDRSPCGTGTSAKLACLAADKKLAEGEEWTQESVIGSTFTARYRWKSKDNGEIVPTISGQAYVTGEGLLRLESDDPFRWGIRRWSGRP